MLSPAKKHRLKMQAAQEAAKAAADKPQTGDQYQLMKVALIEDRRRLHDIQSIERKIEVKKDLMPQYLPYIDGVLAAGTGAEDDVLMTLMIWLLDIGDMKKGLEVADYALTHKLSSPDNYQRTTATIIAEEVADYYLRKVAAKESVCEGVDQLALTSQLTESHDMPDQVKAKLCKALGLALRDCNNFDAALTQLKRALELDERSGVKSEIAKLEKELPAA